MATMTAKGLLRKMDELRIAARQRYDDACQRLGKVFAEGKGEIAKTQASEEAEAAKLRYLRAEHSYQDVLSAIPFEALNEEEPEPQTVPA